jgi:uncharacterized protein YijF (DUF1287 family)
MIDRRSLLAGGGAAFALAGCGSSAETKPPFAPSLATGRRTARLIAAARRQIGVTIRYDSGYSRLPFPGGDGFGGGWVRRRQIPKARRPAECGAFDWR